MNGNSGFTLPFPRGLTLDRVAFKRHAIIYLSYTEVQVGPLFDCWHNINY